MTDIYDLVIIGGGSAGLTAAEFGPNLGARVALVEKHRIGGDCTWTGCIPSKTLIHIAGLAHAARTSAALGVSADPVVDMARVRERVQATVQRIYHEESPDVLRGRGIDVFLGGATFVDPHTIRSGDSLIRGRKFLIATGASPAVPAVAGLAETPYLTYAQFFDNDRLPERLLVMGAGAVGVELAQAYRRLGAGVTLIDERLLPREETEVGEAIGRALAAEGVEFAAGLATAVTYAAGVFTLQLTTGAAVMGDMLLVATGRRPNVHGLGLEHAGVAFSDAGIRINRYAQTSARHIYAAGDVTGSHQFTHYAGWQAFLAGRNALLPGRDVATADAIPYAIFTDPEVARAGLTEAEARARHGDDIRVTVESVEAIDRAITDGADQGFVKLIHRRDGSLLGVTIVAKQAAEMVHEYALALTHGLKLRDLAEAIHVYPTYSLGTQTLAARLTAEGLLGNPLVRRGTRLLGYGRAAAEGAVAPPAADAVA
jgi:pyruvate/2-oxoglutarate dehydrogenase complex dihydrolipoamide dehydrogenase (E3) component